MASDDAIFLIAPDGSLQRARYKMYPDEDRLQTLVAQYPDLLVGDQINPDTSPRWLLIQRETGIPDDVEVRSRCSMDHLLLDQYGVPTFVEVKRSSDTRIRRKVVGQMLDYAANASRYWGARLIRSLATEQYGDRTTWI